MLLFFKATTEHHNNNRTLHYYFLKFHRTEPNIKDNFKPIPNTFTIERKQLIVNLNTAPRRPPEVIKPTPKVANKSNNVTTGNKTSPDKNITTNKNLVSQAHVTYVVHTSPEKFDSRVTGPNVYTNPHENGAFRDPQTGDICYSRHFVSVLLPETS